MHEKLKINFVYKPEHKIYFCELRKRLEEQSYEVSELELDEVLEPLDTHEFYILSEDFKDDHELKCFGFIKNAQIVIRDNQKDYINLDFNYVVSKFYEITKMQSDFSQLTSQIEREVERLQTWYQKQAPIREEKNEAIYLCSKHKSGSQPGGDFFETIDTGASVQIVLTHTNSYIMNARILELIMSYKHEEKRDLDELAKSFTEIQKSFSSSELNLTLVEISKRDLSILGYQFGKNDFYDLSHNLKVTSNTLIVDEYNFKEAYFSGKLNHAQKIVLSSRGCIQNWKKNLDLSEYYQLLSTASEPKKDLEKIILKLYEEDSLEYDTSIIWTEVNSHGIYEA